MFPITFSSTLSPTFSDLMRNIWDGAVDPSASLNNRLPRKSVSLIVPARINSSQHRPVRSRQLRHCR
jgi:hypothetical protein